MFRHYKDLCDVVSLLVYCPSEKSYLLTKESSGEYWIPSSKVEKNCWKSTAHRINFEMFGVDAGSSCMPLRVYKIWLPHHNQPCVYHAVYKVSVKGDVKKKTKIKSGVRNRLHWFSTIELERQKAHCTLRSPELWTFTQMAIGEQPKDSEGADLESGTLIEICEDNVILGADVAGGAVALASPNCQLLQAASYLKDDQIRIYREFMLMVYPAIYMSPHVFTQFMIDLGWQRTQCPSLFRAADVTGRGGLSFLELMLWTAVLEPSTQHSGIPAEIRCRYIFRYFDSNRDTKLEYIEFKELIAAARVARQLPVDSLSVARDADLCLSQLGIQPNSQLPLSEFLRGVGELRLRGTSSLLRGPRSISAYLLDLQERERELNQLNPTSSSKVSQPIVSSSQGGKADEACRATGQVRSASAGPRQPRPDYTMATYIVKLRKKQPNDMLELSNFEEDAVSSSTSRLLAAAVNSLDVLGPTSAPVEALAAVHYFASSIEKPHKRESIGNSLSHGKPAWSWTSPNEEAALGSLLFKLAEAARPICTEEPRVIRIASPVYIIGDLHGNLAALLAMEASLWPLGTSLTPAKILFLGDYVDRGIHGTELMTYLLAAKIQRPNGIFLVRGNHETRDIQKMFTFYNECVAKYGETDGNKIWNAINNVFDALPLAAVVDDKVFCCHGGIPPPWVCPLISAIDKVPVPLPKPAEQSSIAWELLWNDPVKPNKMTATVALELAANEGFAANSRRGTGHVFDQIALDRFLLANQLSHVVRAHEMHQNGFMYQLKGRLVSIFSSHHYCGGNNDCGVVLLEGDKIRLIKVNTD